MKKEVIISILGAIGSGIAWFFGGWDKDLQTLIVIMGIDFVLGLLLGFLGKSAKTEGGGLSSTAGLKGIAKKAAMLLLVAFAALVDRYTGADLCRNAICLALIANEAISLLENFGLLGLPLPERLKDAIENLKNNTINKTGGNQNGN